jgi:Domain of Unknown Function (DUF1080)
MLIRPSADRCVLPLAAALCALLVLNPVSPGAQGQSGGKSEPGWQPLFDGKTLADWEATKFVAEGPVRVEDGRIILEPGRNITGINWTGSALPTTNYELALQAMRVEGSDFFAGITFPVDESFCSLILGGWGGSVVGLSSINGMDASENDTSQSVEFENGRWYAVRIRVTPAKIEAWLDDRQIITQELKEHKIDTRLEMELSKPLGIASYKTRAALRDIRLKRL